MKIRKTDPDEGWVRFGDLSPGDTFRYCNSTEDWTTDWPACMKLNSPAPNRAVDLEDGCVFKVHPDFSVRLATYELVEVL